MSIRYLPTIWQWHHKRVLYATPQTLLNDLVSGICDALDIVLLVVGASLRRCV